MAFLILALSLACAGFQDKAWETHRDAGLRAFEQGKFVEAESRARRALAVREESAGPDHPDVAVTLANLAEI